MNETCAGPRRPALVVTKEHRRFVEFCDACWRDRYIGVCTGAPGVGKTLSARRYTRWDMLEARFAQQRRVVDLIPAPAELAACRSMLYTPDLMVTPKRLTAALHALRMDLKLTVDLAEHPEIDRLVSYLELPDRTELVLVDEADRLTLPAIEQVRDLYDRYGFGLVLIGMPGLERRLARYPQLSSRVGFVHHYRALSAEELRFVLVHKWHELGLTFAVDDFTDAEALAAISRITGGNFRLLQRLLAQIERVLAINGLLTISTDVVDAARDSLVIGPLG